MYRYCVKNGNVVSSQSTAAKAGAFVIDGATSVNRLGFGTMRPPYDDMLIATKAGLARTGPDHWIPLGRPEYLIQQAYTSCHRLGVDQIGLWQLHRIDPKVPSRGGHG
jgi:hypothetical protein